MHVGGMVQNTINPQIINKTTEFAVATLDAETRKLLEYWLLVTMPKYKNKWQCLFG